MHPRVPLLPSSRQQSRPPGGPRDVQRRLRQAPVKEHERRAVERRGDVRVGDLPPLTQRLRGRVDARPGAPCALIYPARSWCCLGQGIGPCGAQKKTATGRTEPRWDEVLSSG